RGRLACEGVEPRQRGAKVDPETGHRCRVGTRRSAADCLCHGPGEHTPLELASAVPLGKRRAVLDVDDESAIRFLCRINLELEGFRVLEAATAEEARERLAAEDVDVALVDVHIGSADGRELVRELRVARSPPAIALLTGS